MRKVLIVTEIFFPEKYPINDLYFDWLKKDYKVDVFTRIPTYPLGIIFPGYKNKIFSAEQNDKSIIYRTFVFLGYKKYKVLKMLNYLIYIVSFFCFLLFKGKKYDKIFFYQTGPLTNILAASILKRISKFKIAIWIQDLWPQTLYAYGFGKNKFSKFLIESLVKYIYKRTDQFYVSSGGFAKYLAPYAAEKKIDWVPNWLTDIPVVEPQSIQLEGDFNFTFAGNIGQAQKLDTVILGFHQISQKNDKVFLNIIGDGSKAAELKSIIAEHNIKNVKFYGFLPLEQTVLYFKESDVLILSLESKDAFAEVIPVKFQSYLASQKPIYAITNGVVNRFVQENSLGFCADPTIIDTIAEGFEKFIHLQSSDLELYAKNAKMFNETMFKKEAQLEKFEKLFLQNQ